MENLTLFIIKVESKICEKLNPQFYNIVPQLIFVVKFDKLAYLSYFWNWKHVLFDKHEYEIYSKKQVFFSRYSTHNFILNNQKISHWIKVVQPVLISETEKVLNNQHEKNLHWWNIFDFNFLISHSSYLRKNGTIQPTIIKRVSEVSFLAKGEKLLGLPAFLTSNVSAEWLQNSCWAYVFVT